MSFEIKYHGGNCCGMKHIHNIPIYSESNEVRLKDKIEQIQSLRSSYDQKNFIAIEMIFTDSKLKNGWKEALERLGFKHTVRWKNPNSPNYCNQYVWTKPKED